MCVLFFRLFLSVILFRADEFQMNVQLNKHGLKNRKEKIQRLKADLSFFLNWTEKFMKYYHYDH